MRKNGVNKELKPIDGGICAPKGFRASGVRCGIAPVSSPFYHPTREDLALIAADKLVPTACVYADSGECGAPVITTKKHLKSGYSRAVIVNSGIANCGVEGGEKLAKTVCTAIAKRLKISASETVIASTGAITGKFPIDTLLSGVNKLADSLGCSHEHSLAAARALMTADTAVKQLSFSFMLGDYECKIGAIFKGSRRVCPNMATTLCFLTTDVNISREMLQKALSAVVGDTFNMLNVDGISSPNDTVCIMASGNAGNYKIDCADSEYKKFVYALKETAWRVCKAIVADGEGKSGVFSCSVSGAKSKNAARNIAKAVAGAIGTRKAFAKNEVDVEGILCSILTAGERVELSNVEISLSSEQGKFLLLDEGKSVAFSHENAARILSGADMEICIRLHTGNYSAQALGCF